MLYHECLIKAAYCGSRRGKLLTYSPYMWYNAGAVQAQMSQNLDLAPHTRYMPGVSDAWQDVADSECRNGPVGVASGVGCAMSA